MKVRVEKKLTTKQKKWSKVNSQKGLTVIKCWLTQGKEANEKEANHPADSTDRMVNWCSHGGWFTLVHKLHKILSKVE
jgi:hypothetical protein